jgi:DNA-binding NarL/FixJ family response regulator
VFLVEDHPITLEGLTQIVNYQSDLIVCGSAASASEALRKIPQLRPELVITDLTLANGNGLDLVKDIVRLHPTVPTLVLSMHDEKIYAERALRAGARGYVMKNEQSAKLLSQIRATLAGEIAVSESVRSAYLGRIAGGAAPGADLISTLTDRELEVFRLLGEGCGTSEIAERLHLGVSTIETHRARIKEKLNLVDATELVAAAARWVAAEH